MHRREGGREDGAVMVMVAVAVAAGGGGAVDLIQKNLMC